MVLYFVCVCVCDIYVYTYTWQVESHWREQRDMKKFVDSVVINVQEKAGGVITKNVK